MRRRLGRGRGNGNASRNFQGKNIETPPLPFCNPFTLDRQQALSSTLASACAEKLIDGHRPARHGRLSFCDLTDAVDRGIFGRRRAVNAHDFVGSLRQ